MPPAKKATKKSTAPPAGRERATRLRLAEAEKRQVKAWENSGKKGRKPATPNLDAIRDQSVKGVAAKPAAARARIVPTVQFRRAGKTLHGGQPRYNRLSVLAIRYTKGMGQQGDTLTVAQFRAWLAKHGVADPDNTTWRIVLPNGEDVGALARGDKYPVLSKTDAERVKTPRTKREAMENVVAFRKATRVKRRK